MNKLITLILITTVFVFSCKKDNIVSGEGTINVTINDVPNGRKVYLKKQEGRNIIVLDSTTVNNGKFGFKNNIEEPMILGIFIDSIKSGIYPFVGIKDEIKIKAYKDSLFASEIKGSKLHDDLSGLRKMRKDLTKEMSAFTKEFMEARKTKDTKKLAEINAKAKVIQDKISLNEWNYITAHPDSHVSVMVLSGLVQNPSYADSIQPAFDKLSDTVKNSIVAKQLKEFLENKNNPKVPSVGK